MLRQIREAIKIKNPIIVGDFNYPHIDWEHFTSGRNAEIKFLDTLNDYFMEQLVREPTRGEATLDLILSGAQELVQESPPGLSSAPNALILSPPVDVTLDPDTAHAILILSGKSVRWGDTGQRRTNNLERFNCDPCVLGCEGFTSGRHCWEVEVGDAGGWAVGVASVSVRRKGGISCSPEGGIWAVERWWGQVQALTSPVTPLPLSRVPSRIRVCLDCDRGQVTFIDAGDEAPIFTFPPGSVPGERIRPWLWVGMGSRLSLCP
uniref:B30.2/SPRY domain-containing protein n=1 Tax=Gopherus agassizii TaxID=38772 RepID=A0A452I138_9SAUR